MSRKRHINRVVIGAYLVRDPELRSTKSGRSVCNMRVGVHDAGDEYNDGYFDVVAWDDQADHCARYLKAGSEIDVDGRLRFHEFERQDGSKGSEVSIVADRINFAGGGNGKTSDGDGDAAPDEAPAGAGAPDDIPF